MYPDQNQNQQQPESQYSIDYLNQIAPPQKKPGFDNRKFIFLAAGGLIVAIIIVILSLSSSSAGPKEKMQTLAARMQTLRTISDKSQKSIKSGTLRSSNSNLTIFLTNANRDIAAPFLKNGVDIKKIDKKITAAENGTDLTNKLENARLNAVFDRTYSREMGYKLDTVAALMKDIYNNTKSKSLKDFLTQTDDNLQPIKKQLYDFNAAND